MALPSESDPPLPKRAVSKARRDGIRALAASGWRAGYRAVHSRTQSCRVAAQLARSDSAPISRVGVSLRRALTDDFSPGSQQRFAAIQSARQHLDTSDRLVEGINDNQPLAALPKCSSGPGRLLFALADEHAPDRILELGTCVGISAAYQATALDDGAVVTLEAAAGRVDVAERVFAGLGLNNITTVQGRFETTLDATLDEIGPVGMALIDGHHREDATLRYFDCIYPSLADGAVVVFDDIHWSDGMERAWSRLTADPRLDAVLDVSGYGIGVVHDTPRRTSPKQAYL